MKRQLSCWALFACIATGALLLAGCSTVSSRIEGNRAAFDQLAPKDQALVSQGRIAPGMSQQAVYMAWGQPQQKAIGMVREIATESWVYTEETWVLSTDDPTADQEPPPEDRGETSGGGTGLALLLAALGVVAISGSSR